MWCFGTWIEDHNGLRLKVGLNLPECEVDGSPAVERVLLVAIANDFGPGNTVSVTHFLEEMLSWCASLEVLVYCEG